MIVDKNDMTHTICIWLPNICLYEYNRMVMTMFFKRYKCFCHCISLALSLFQCQNDAWLTILILNQFENWIRNSHNINVFFSKISALLVFFIDFFLSFMKLSIMQTRDKNERIKITRTENQRRDCTKYKIRSLIHILSSRPVPESNRRTLTCLPPPGPLLDEDWIAPDGAADPEVEPGPLGPPPLPTRL